MIQLRRVGRKVGTELRLGSGDERSRSLGGAPNLSSSTTLPLPLRAMLRKALRQQMAEDDAQWSNVSLGRAVRARSLCRVASHGLADFLRGEVTAERVHPLMFRRMC